ncbi:MAG: helix-turn-helix transcriptional regulator [Rudaea sp.]|uniref:helix-turn-helix domain-containing protein n=1 Tax=Rudaea sp. TaxID=2136325 RepID=UPI0039E4649C
MNALTDIQTIKGPDGAPAFVVLPYADFLRRFAHEEGLIPHDVVSATVDGASPMKAWREYLGLTQADVAARLGVSQAAYAQTEAAARPRKATVARVAEALRIGVEQLDF